MSSDQSSHSLKPGDIVDVQRALGITIRYYGFRTLIITYQTPDVLNWAFEIDYGNWTDIVTVLDPPIDIIAYHPTYGIDIIGAVSDN